MLDPKESHLPGRLAVLPKDSKSSRLTGSAAVVGSQGELGMIKSDLVWRIRAQNSHLYLRDVEKIVDNGVFVETTATLARGDRIELRGFGTLSVKVREARTGRNPNTGALVQVPKKAAPHFKAGQEMRERLNRREE